MYLVHFHGDRDYFECHEILEEYWKMHDSGNKESIWVGLIQLAVSCYHHRRNNFQGAKKTLNKALTVFLKEKAQINSLGLDEPMLISLVTERLKVIEQKKAYQSFNIPINDRSLLECCMKECHILNLDWGQCSDLKNIHLIDRHKLRDRTDVIEERESALAKKGSEII
jgi:predicted metal-dependent hydrolase